MGKILVFLYDNMADFEMTFASTMMIGIKKEVITIANSKDEIKAFSGLQYLPQMTVKDTLELDDVDGLIIPGGWKLDLSEELKTLIVKLKQENKLLASICAGPQYFAKASVLDDVIFTTTLSKESIQKNNLEDNFNWDHYVKQNVVKDKNVITALGNAFVDFGIELIDYFGEFQDEKQKEAYRKHYKALD